VFEFSSVEYTTDSNSSRLKRLPRFLTAVPPTDADIATVLQQISRRVIRALRKLGYLETETPDAVPTGYDPASDEDPELARALAEVSSTPNVTSVQQHLAFGERAGQRVFSIDMERCPVCQQGTLRIIAAIMARSVIQKILRHLKLSEDPPPIAPSRQSTFTWDF
jgi:hypothetical protein